MASATVQFTRPNDTSGYTANDVVGAAGGGSGAMQFVVGPGDGGLQLIRGFSLRRDGNAVIASETSYSLHFYNVTPPSAIADNAAFDVPSGDRAAYLGFLTSGNIADLGSTCWVESNGLAKPVNLLTSSIWAYLVTTGAYTPVAQHVYTVSLHTEMAVQWPR